MYFISARKLLGTLGLITTILFSAGAANALPTTSTFQGTVVGGAFQGTVGTGNFTFEETLITGVGTEVLTPAAGLTVEFTIFSQTFTEANDINFDGFPKLTVIDGVIDSLDFVINELFGDVLTDIDEPGVVDISMLELDDGAGTGFDFLADIVINDQQGVGVPEPGALALMGIGLLGLGLARRRWS